MIILVSVVLPAILTVVCILLNPKHRIFIIWIVLSLQCIKGLVINRYIYLKNPAFIFCGNKIFIEPATPYMNCSQPTYYDSYKNSYMSKKNFFS